MDKQLTFEIVDIIKRSKQDIYTAMDKESKQDNEQFDYSERFGKVEKLLQDINTTINMKSHVFNVDFNSKEEMKDAIASFMDEVNQPVVQIAEIYTALKSQFYESDTLLAAVRLVKKVLLEYLLFIDRIESLILRSSKGKIVFEPDIKEEVEAFLATVESRNTPKEKGPFLTLLAMFGLGYMLGSE